MAPRSIEQTDWLSHAIDEMQRICASMQPSSAEADAEAIRLIASRIQTAADLYEKSLAALYPEGEFHGESVTGSRTATVNGIRHMDGSASVGLKIADQISAIAGILSKTQGEVADLQARYADSEGGVIERTAHRSLLAKTMSDSYSNPVIGANGSLPEYDAAPLPELGSDFEPTRLQAISGGAGGGSGDSSPALFTGAGGSGPNGPNGPGGPGGPGSDPTTYANQSPTDTPLAIGGADTAATNADGSTPGPLNGAFATPSAGAGAGISTAASGLGSRGGSSGSGGGAGGGSTAGGRAGGGGIGSGSGGVGAGANPLGRPTAASLLGPSAGNAQPGGATPAAAPRGGTPMGPAGGGRGAGKDKDGQHRAPSYLHTRENGDEIVGRLPLVGPPVLGDWARVANIGGAGEGPGSGSPGTDTDGSHGPEDNANRT